VPHKEVLRSIPCRRRLDEVRQLLLLGVQWCVQHQLVHADDQGPFFIFFTFTESQGSSHGELNQPSPQFEAYGPMAIARHVIGCHLIQAAMVQTSFDDVPSTIHQSLPMMPFSGVRISCDMLARNCDLASFAAFAILSSASDQGLTLVNCSAQRKHVLWDTLGARISPSLLDKGTRGGVTKTA